MNEPDEKVVETLQQQGNQRDKDDPTKFWKSDGVIIRVTETDGDYYRNDDEPNWKKV